MFDPREEGIKSKAWPFEEARRLLNRYKDVEPSKGYVLFQTGYGPSGLPHIGTFGEVSRTTMVKKAFDITYENELLTLYNFEFSIFAS